MQKNNITETKTINGFYETIVDQVKKQFKLAIEEKGFFSLVLTGGNTPLLLFEKLKNVKKTEIDWSKVYIFWADERCVLQNSSDNNFFSANERFLKDLNLGGVFPINTMLSPQESATKYQQIKDSFFFEKKVNSFDMVLLGMGLDGHIASVFDSKQNHEEKDVYCTKDDSFSRVTMSLKLINEINFKLLMLKGIKKIDYFFLPSVNQPKDKVNYDLIVTYNDSI